MPITPGPLTAKPALAGARCCPLRPGVLPGMTRPLFPARDCSCRMFLAPLVYFYVPPGMNVSSSPANVEIVRFRERRVNLWGRRCRRTIAVLCGNTALCTFVGSPLCPTLTLTGVHLLRFLVASASGQGSSLRCPGRMSAHADSGLRSRGL